MLRTSVRILVGVVALSLMSGCANMHQQRRWGTCGLVGGLLGAGAGAGIGVAINENTGDHENMIAWTTSLGGAGLFLGAEAGHYLCDPIVSPPIPPPPPPPPLPPPPPPPPPPPVQKLILRGVHFDFNKSKIRPGDAAILDDAASTLKANPNVTINSTV